MLKCGMILPLLLLFGPILVQAKTRHRKWTIKYTNVTRLCYTKPLISVNGQFPGPTVYVREGDNVIVKIVNKVDRNVTIHWHGVRQFLTAWSDGPAYITQCPIQTGQSFVHNFTVVGQRGTLFWHAHISWLRATLYGAFIILPKKHVKYPFGSHFIEPAPLVLGEWWNADVEAVIAESLVTGNGYNLSDALTINGQPGALYTCSQQDTVVYNINQGETMLLRIINAAMNFELFFGVTNHTLTVVEADAEYTEPYTTDVIVIAPGQSTNVLLTANQPIGEYYMAASVFSPAPLSLIPFPSTPTTAILQYQGSNSSNSPLVPTLPSFPMFNDTPFQINFTQSLRGLRRSSGYYYMDLPQEVDESLLYTVGYGSQPCPEGQTCLGPFGDKLALSVSNITFASPNISILQAYYYHINGVYGTNFPDVPLFQYNYTGFMPENITTRVATEVKVLPFNTSVQIVFQDTATLIFETHPMHLHGQNFYVVGTGLGNFDPRADPPNFNLVDPPSRNTVAVPAGGWAAIRFKAINPGVWLLHCHIDFHIVLGMAMAFIVENGVGPLETLPPPPSDMPLC